MRTKKSQLRPGRVFPFLIFALAAVACQPAARAAEGDITLELNKLEGLDAACRAYILLTNKTKAAFSSLKLDLVMFDKDGIVARRVAVEAAPIVAGKTSLKVFDIQGLKCDGIGRVLLNGVMSCSGDGGPRADCIGLIAASSRAGVPLIK